MTYQPKQKGIIVRLAIKSLLYLPVYIMAALWKDRRESNGLLASTDLHLDWNKAYPPVPEANHCLRDEWIRSVFFTNACDEQIVVGVGDPVRSRWLPQTAGTFEEPAVLCSLITKYAYSIVTGSDSHGHLENVDAFQDPFASFLGLITHPVGMTGYLAAVHAVAHAYGYGSHSSEADWKQVASFLLPLRNAPDQEQALFDAISEVQVARWLSQKKRPPKQLPGRDWRRPTGSMVKRPFAYLTTDPLTRIRRDGYVRHEEPILNMWHNLSDTKLCMTALVVSARVASSLDPFVVAAREALVCDLQLAVELLRGHPDWCAELLWAHYIQDLVDHGVTDSEAARKRLLATPFHGMSRYQLGAACSQLSKADVYEVKRVDRNFWTQTLRAHQPVFEFMAPKELRASRDEAAMERLVLDGS